MNLENVVIACHGQYLEGSVADVILKVNEVFGHEVAYLVLSGSHYWWGKLGTVMVLVKPMHCLILPEFWNVMWWSQKAANWNHWTGEFWWMSICSVGILWEGWIN